MSMHSIARWVKIVGAYLLVAAIAALGWLWCALPEQVCLEPEQPLLLPRFGWVEPLRGHGSRNVASTRAVGSYQATRRWAVGCRSKPSAPRWWSAPQSQYVVPPLG